MLLQNLQTSSPHVRQWWRLRNRVNAAPHSRQCEELMLGSHCGELRSRVPKAVGFNPVGASNNSVDGSPPAAPFVRRTKPPPKPPNFTAMEIKVGWDKVAPSNDREAKWRSVIVGIKELVSTREGLQLDEGALRKYADADCVAFMRDLLDSARFDHLPRDAM